VKELTNFSPSPFYEIVNTHFSFPRTRNTYGLLDRC